MLVGVFLPPPHPKPHPPRVSLHEIKRGATIYRKQTPRLQSFLNLYNRKYFYSLLQI